MIAAQLSHDFPQIFVAGNQIDYDSAGVTTSRRLIEIARFDHFLLHSQQRVLQFIMGTVETGCKVRFQQ